MKVGDREVVQSGSIITEANRPVTIEVEDLTVIVEFAQGNFHPPTMEIHSESEKFLNLSLKGFNNPLGTAFDRAIGEMRGQRLVLALYVHSIPGPEDRFARLLHYTFTVGGQYDG